MRSLITILLFALFLLNHVESFKRGKRFFGSLNKGLRAEDLKASAGELWFTNQKVNHFDLSDTRVWSQKYFVNTTYWQTGNPIFLFLGGEGPLSASSVGDRYITGAYAQYFKAAIVSLEHRFYGDSMPLSDSSPASLKLLSSEQALADAAWFRQYIAQSVLNSTTSKWIVFGGSYSGALAAWARHKYPHLFQGAFASSGPVNAVEDFNQYLQVVSDSLGPTCSANVAKANSLIENLLQSTSGRQQLQAAFNTCSSINTQLDVITFLEDITDPICEVVQYNHDNNGHSSFDITQLCAIFASQSDPVAAWAQVVQLVEPGCVEVDYNQMISELQPTSAGRSWTWQTCTEFGYYQTGELPTQPFSSLISLSYFRQICQDAYGPMRTSPDTDWINSDYGSLSIKQAASNIYFGDGTIDPWHALAVLPEGGKAGQQLLQSHSATVLINGTAHCADLYAAAPSDLPDLTFARQLAQDLIAQWLSGEFRENSQV